MVLKSIFRKKNSVEKQNAQEQLQPKEIRTEDSNSNSNLSFSSLSQSPSNSNQNEEPPVALHLEKSMIENAREDNSTTRTRVYQELLFSNVLLALADEAEPSEVPQNVEPLHKGNDNVPTTTNKMNIAILSNQQGIHFAAAFTSAKSAKLWRAEGGHYVSIRGQELFKLLENSPVEVIVVNPGSAPFVTLDKIQFKQLAMGIVPNTDRSPVQAAQVNPEGSASENGEENSGIQVAFPPDAFSEEQKQHTLKTLSKHDKITAVAVGALLPPNANKETGWVRAVFLRTNDLELQGEGIQKFCLDIREEVVHESKFFKDFHFEVGVMPDPEFWKAVNANKFSLFDKEMH